MNRELNQINVIPLVDVMLVLLVIVLTTATFINAGQIPVNLAKAAAANERQDTSLIITVTAEDELFVNDHAVPDEQLDAALSTHPRESMVLVRADKVTRLERFVTVVDRVRGLGFRQVSSQVIRP
ncbi:MAG: biopolymer transporter ExbD [Nitrospirota bacterium]